MTYDKVECEAFYRLKMAEQTYEKSGLCVFFHPIQRSPLDEDMGYAGRIVVLGFCWWKQADDKRVVRRAGRRYEHYVQKRR